MPTPSAKESKPEFISRCMGFPDMQEYDTEQRYAICQSKWSEAKMAKVSKYAIIKVSFDYDGVISTEAGKLKAKKLIANGDTCYIISARRNKADLLGAANAVRIPENNVYATGSNEAKVAKVKSLNIDIHYDNNPDVVKALGPIGKLFNA